MPYYLFGLIARIMKTGIVINGLIKNAILGLRIHFFLGWFLRPLLLASNTIALARWMSAHKKIAFNDFYSFTRCYTKRERLYQFIIEHFGLNQEPIDYIEFGVHEGNSLKWWANHLPHSDNHFYGFDTFEGLPEDWGLFFKKGDMFAKMPVITDKRIICIKGLFQNTLYSFLTDNCPLKDKRKVIHLDADLFSSTMYVLTTLYPHLKKGDIILFDEFNVPNHEFMAYNIFIKSCPIKMQLVGAVNNYWQVAFLVV